MTRPPRIKWKSVITGRPTIAEDFLWYFFVWDQFALDSLYAVVLGQLTLRYWVLRGPVPPLPPSVWKCIHAILNVYYTYRNNRCRSLEHRIRQPAPQIPDIHYKNVYCEDRIVNFPISWNTKLLISYFVNNKNIICWVGCTNFFFSMFIFIYPVHEEISFKKSDKNNI